MTEKHVFLPILSPQMCSFQGPWRANKLDYHSFTDVIRITKVQVPDAKNFILVKEQQTAWASTYFSQISFTPSPIRLTWMDHNWCLHVQWVELEERNPEHEKSESFIMGSKLASLLLWRKQRLILFSKKLILFSMLNILIPSEGDTIFTFQGYNQT